MFSGGIARYRAFLSQPDVGRLLLAALFTRLPLGTVMLAMLMHVQSLTGSFATAGGTVGSYLFASAVTAPILGRIVDRRGPAPILVITGIVCPAALVLLLLARPLALTPPLMIAAAALAGAFVPPISVLTRTMWRHRFEDERARLLAFSVDGVLIETAFTTGPMIVAATMAVASATAAFAVAVGLTALAVPLFALSPALKYWQRSPAAKRHLLGPLTEPRLAVVYAVVFLFTFCLGLTEVGYPGYATGAGIAALSGVLLAINSLGSATGGLAYGALHLHMAAERQLPRILAAMAVPLALQAATGSAWLLGALAFAAGVLIAPVFALTAMLVTSIAPPRYATEAFTWSATCIVGGLGAGQALGGRLLEASGYSAVFALSAGAAMAAAAFAWSLRTRALRLRAGS